MTSDIPDGRRAAVRAYPMTILRYAASNRADGRAQSDGRIRIGIATSSGAFGSGPEVDWLVAILRVRIGPAYSTSILGQQLVAELGGLVSADGRLVPDNILVRCLFRR